jgi:sugar phosphate isomerase/epimerase
MIDRRQALSRMGALAAGAATIGCTGEDFRAEADPAMSATPGHLSPIGLQLYTVRSEMQKGVEATLERVAAIGYREVEFAGYFDHTAAEIREMLERTGLTAPSSHVPASFQHDAWSRILEEAAEAGHEFVTVAWTEESMRADLDAWRRMAEAMNQAGEMARQVGLQYAYHNHDFEFDVMEGEVPFDVLCEATDPELVQIELDLFWIVHGGGDPFTFFDRWPGRVPMVHVKDRTAAGAMVDVGQGEIDFAAVFRRIDDAGMRHFFVEHDSPADAFRSIASSYTYLTRLEIPNRG